MAGWRVFAIWGVAACVKVLLWPSYHSTDFEVHRNWLAVTYSTSPETWYADVPGQSEWTLDYPPAFALMERVLASGAALVDARVVDVTQRDYAEWSCVAFQRATVVALDFACLGGAAWYAESLVPADSRLAAHALWAGGGLASLVLVDHVHFQYNGVFLGVWLAVLAALSKRAYYGAAVLFAALLGLKHLFLTLAPFVTTYLFAVHVVADCDSLLDGCLRLSRLGATTVATLVASACPVLLPAVSRTGVAGASLAARELGARLFPFGKRGLVHSYWAPNAWALYVFVDRVALKLAGSASLDGAGTFRSDLAIPQKGSEEP